MIKYYKLFDLLNRRDMNKSALLDIISSKTIAKLSKGENITTDVINKICEFLHCQPEDIMEYVEIGTYMEIEKDCKTEKEVEIAPHDTWEGLEELRPEPDHEINVYEHDKETDSVKRIL